MNEITTQKLQSKPPWWRWYEPPPWWPGWLHALTCTHCRHLARHVRELRRSATASNHHPKENTL